MLTDYFVRKTGVKLMYHVKHKLLELVSVRLSRTNGFSVLINTGDLLLDNVERKFLTDYSCKILLAEQIVENDPEIVCGLALIVFGSHELGSHIIVFNYRRSSILKTHCSDLFIRGHLPDYLSAGCCTSHGDVDAAAVSATGTRVIQLHTGGSCHMDADMTKRGLEGMDIDDLDLIFLENVGNLVCPAEFDVGANLKVMILSVPEGDDKPLKYPLMFKVSDCLLNNKIDTEPAFDFNFAVLRSRVLDLNPDMNIIRMSSLTGDGFDEWTEYLVRMIERQIRNGGNNEDH